MAETEKKPTAPKAAEKATDKKPDAAAAAKPVPAEKALPRLSGAPLPIALVGAESQLTTLRFSPCGKFMFGSGLCSKVFRWDITKTEKSNEPPPASIDDVLDSGKAAKKPPAKKPANTPPAYLPLAELPALEGHRGWVDALAISTTEPRVFTGDSWGEIRCWPCSDEAARTIWSVKDAHNGWIRQLAVSPDGKLLASCSVDKQVILWSTADGKKLHTWNEHGTDGYSVTFSPDGKTVLAGDIRGTIRQWNIADHKLVREFDAKMLYLAAEDSLQEIGGVRQMAFDSAGKTLAACGARPAGVGFAQAVPVVILFDVATGKEIKSLDIGVAKDGFVHDLTFHPDGFWIGVTSGQPGNGQIFCWKAGEEKPNFLYSKLANCHSVAIHSDKTRIAVTATNAASAGNGRRNKEDSEYFGNFSPVAIWDVAQLKT